MRELGRKREREKKEKEEKKKERKKINQGKNSYMQHYIKHINPFSVGTHRCHVLNGLYLFICIYLDNNSMISIVLGTTDSTMNTEYIP